MNDGTRNSRFTANSPKISDIVYFKDFSRVFQFFSFCLFVVNL